MYFDLLSTIHALLWCPEIYLALWELGHGLLCQNIMFLAIFLPRCTLESYVIFTYLCILNLETQYYYFMFRSIFDPPRHWKRVYFIQNRLFGHISVSILNYRVEYSPGLWNKAKKVLLRSNYIEIYISYLILAHIYRLN